MTEPTCLTHTDEPRVTREHRERAASTLHEIGHPVEYWIQTGGLDPSDPDPLNDDLTELAQAFADFEHEILLCPTTVVHGLEESTTVCSHCGTTDEDYHTLRDCFARYKRAQDDATNQVTEYLSEQNAALEAELIEVKRGYEVNERDWQAAMTPIRAALDLPDGSVPEIVAAIETLKQPVTNPHHECVPIGAIGARYCIHCGKDMTPPYPVPLFVFWDEDSIWVVAHDADDAERLYAAHVGGDCTFDRLQFSRWPDEQEITIKIFASGVNTGKIAPVDEESDTGAIAPCTQSARRWADQEGRGFLCTTDC